MESVIPEGNRREDASAPKNYSDFANHISYLLYEIGYQARAARALLHEYEKSDEVEELTGVIGYRINAGARPVRGCRQAWFCIPAQRTADRSPPQGPFAH